MVAKKRTKKSKKTTRTKRKVDELSDSEVSTGSSSIAWEAPEFQYYEKGWMWTAGLLVIAVIFLGVFYYMKDYSAMAVVALAAIVFYQQAGQKPRSIKYRVDEQGFLIDKETIRWNQLKSFWLSAAEGHNPHLYLESIGRFTPTRTLHLANVDPVELRARLQQYLPEHVTRNEAWTDLLIRWLKL